MTIKDLVVPGEPLGPTSNNSPGPGTHIENSQIHASLLGSPSAKTTTDKALHPLLSIHPPFAQRTQPAPLLPTVGTPIYGRVTRLTRTHAHISILLLSPSTIVAVPFRGLLRTQDVRATEKDKVKLAEAFRVGDIVRAVVISLGDQGGYYLSTAGNEYGVVMGWSEEGNGCVPVGWSEVRDEVTGRREGRKVARVG